jgi:predicted nucleic acid-binding protein
MTQGANVYFDTSALAKWYLNEAMSSEVEDYLHEVSPVSISLLTKVEMRSLVARRGREGHLDSATQAKILATFEGDIAAGHLVLQPHTVESFLLAESLLGSQPEVSLTTLDALHLGVMRSAGVTVLATADRVMAQAAAAQNMDCRTFF